MIGLLAGSILSTSFEPGHGFKFTYQLSSIDSLNFPKNKNDGYEAILAFADSPIGAKITIDGTVYTIKEESRLVRISEFPAKVNVLDSTFINVWVIPKDLCNGPIVGQIGDIPHFSFQSEEFPFPKFCYFPMRYSGFSDGDATFGSTAENHKSELYLSDNFKVEGQNPYYVCTETKCKATIDNDGYFISYSASPKSTYTYDATYKLSDVWFTGDSLYVGVTYSKDSVSSLYIETNTTKFSTEDKNKNAMKLGFIIGGVIGGIIIIILIIYIAYIFIKKKKKSESLKELN